jgi:hypothetical protein
MPRVSLYLLVLYLLFGCTQGKVLLFREDGTFKITQFTDMHYGEKDLEDDGSKMVQGALFK